MLTPLVIALIAVSLLCAFLIRKVYRLNAWLESCSRSLRTCQWELENTEKCQEQKELAIHAPQVSAAPKTPSRNWIAHAYPRQQVTIKLQGTRHSNPEMILAYLGTVIERLKAGDSTGQEHDDDFGYHFEFVKASPGPSFFDTPASQR